ncbi:sigma-70 family RNA polymerase sigma factor [Microcoleus sp. Pol10D4]|uniref:sigma-70 family RNA polymerase sigma factor n=1 Tax=Microcoleus sp. Pol10D4 TaxID=3055387 RepID=UPI002FD2A472
MTDIIDRFSTCYQVNPHPRPMQDSRLKQNLQRFLEQHPELNDETVLLKYFCNQAAKNNSHSLAIDHLLAYVDVACYLAAISTYKAFQTPELTLEDYLQIARIYMASRAVELCTKFDRTRSQIQTYLHRPLRDAIMSKVRKNQETERRSDWGLLRITPKEGLKSDLHNFGIREPKLSRCFLTRQGFLEVYAPVKAGTNQRLPKPTAEQWEAIAQFCTEQQFPHSIQPFTVPEVKTLLQICVDALRASTHIQFDSLDAENWNLESETAEQSEQQASNRQQDMEQSDRLQQMTTELASAIACLSPDAKKMLILEHGFTGFNQNYIGKEFGLKQYQVSRNLTGYKRNLLTSLVKWSQTQASVPLTVKDVARLSILLDEWLNWYCQSAILYKFLQTALKLHPALKLEIPLLCRYYYGCKYGCEKVDERAIAHSLNITPTELQEKLVQIKTTLQQQLHQWLEQILVLTPCSLKAIDKSSALLVEQFLANAPYALLTLERR